LDDWTAGSVDVDPNSGSVWVALRRLGNLPGASSLLLKFDSNGEQLASIDMGEKVPFKASVDRTDGSVWVANLQKSVQHFSADGKPLAEYAAHALTVQADPLGGDVWLITPDEIRRMTATGSVTQRIKHPSRTSAAWAAPLE
jgi:hypothetical protein